MSAGKPILGVLEKDTEVSWLIEKSGCGKCCEPGDYIEIEKLINWYIENAFDKKLISMGINGRTYLSEKLTKTVSLRKYIDAIQL